jgi:valyl-tRNA synthetase
MATETQDARMPVQVLCPNCGERFDNPEGKAQVIACPKCKKQLTRPFENAVGTEQAPLCKMTSKRFDEGRNFCTKLWNAAKFVLSNLESVKPRPVVAEGNADSPVTDSISAPGATTGRGFTLADQWIVSRFNRAVDETNAALENYRFDQYAKTCYDFFWRDFCDWYVEAAKPAIKDPARSAATANTLATMLDGILRLMHPMIPFITERLWWKLNQVRPAGRSKRLVLAQWPITGPINDSAEATFGILQEIIVAIRNVRNQYKICRSPTISNLKFQIIAN